MADQQLYLEGDQVGIVQLASLGEEELYEW
jgi:hypothetical protein